MNRCHTGVAGGTLVAQGLNSLKGGQEEATDFTITAHTCGYLSSGYMGGTNPTVTGAFGSFGPCLSV
jgi:hypothetical protein